MSKLCKHRSSNRAYEANITEDRFLNCTNVNFASTCCGVERKLTRNFLDIKLFYSCKFYPPYANCTEHMNIPSAFVVIKVFL
jgi:hypothetical protein